VELKGDAENLALDLQYTTCYFGNLLADRAVRMQKAAAPLTYWTWRAVFATGGSYEARTGCIANHDSLGGREDLGWPSTHRRGTGRFWSRTTC